MKESETELYRQSPEEQALWVATNNTTSALFLTLTEANEIGWEIEPEGTTDAWERAKSKNPAYADKIEEFHQTMLTAYAIIGREGKENLEGPCSREIASQELFSLIPYRRIRKQETRSALGNILLVRVYNPNGSNIDKALGWRSRLNDEYSVMRDELGSSTMNYYNGTLSIYDVVTAVLENKLKLSSSASRQDYNSVVIGSNLT